MSEKFKQVKQVESWLLKRQNISLIQNSIIFIISLVLLGLYSVFTTGYDVYQLMSWGNVVDVIVVNAILVLIKIAINDQTIVSFRNGKEYKEEITDISNLKRGLEKDNYTKELQEFIDIENIERKKRAYLRTIDYQVRKLDKKLARSKKEKRIQRINKRILELEEFKSDVLNNKIDIHKKTVSYNAITRANLFAGSNLEDDRDADIGDKAKSTFFKGNARNTLLWFAILFAFGGVTYSLIDSANYIKLIIYLVSALITTLLTYAITRYYEEYVTLPKLSIRKSFLLEFKIWLKNKIKEIENNE